MNKYVRTIEHKQSWLDEYLKWVCGFANAPHRYSIMTKYEIGRFGKSHSDLKHQDVIEGTILDMADKVIATLDAKYLIRPISYEGLQRIEGLEYPELVLLEAILNSILCKHLHNFSLSCAVRFGRDNIWRYFV